MGPKEMLALKRAELVAKLNERNTRATALTALRGQDDVDVTQVEGLLELKRALDTEIDGITTSIGKLEVEIARDELADDLAQRHEPTGAKAPASRASARVVSEPRTYAPENDKTGQRFIADVLRASVVGDPTARQRLERHTTEELTERGEAFLERATSTANYAGVVVPQYLTDLFAGTARGGRPLADAMRHHDLPETGMTVNIGRATTGTTSASQASENSAVSETNFDDTLLTIPVRTGAGSATVSRQAIGRGAGALDITMEDLFDAHATDINSQIITTATVGLSAFATAGAYTDATPTAAELYPKFLEGASALEVALLNKYKNDAFAVMHPRRWNWISAALTTSWPFLNQPGVPGQAAGVNYGEAYGGGYRGLLPNGMPVIVDGGIPTNKGVGTNEDEIYIVPQSESHLWEDPAAPMFIYADQTNAKTLGIDLVVYSFFAFSFERYPAAIRKIGGTGLITPTF